MIITLNLQRFSCTCFLVEPCGLNVHNAHVGTWSLKAKGWALMFDHFYILHNAKWTWIVCRVQFGLCNCIIEFKFNESFCGGSLMEPGGLPGGYYSTLEFGTMLYELSSSHECGFCCWGIVSRSLTLSFQRYEFLFLLPATFEFCLVIREFVVMILVHSTHFLEFLFLLPCLNFSLWVHRCEYCAWCTQVS